MMCALILWKSGLGLLMGDFVNFWQSLVPMTRPYFKLGMCIDIVKIWFGIANGQILSVFDRVICGDMIVEGIIISHIIFPPKVLVSWFSFFNSVCVC